MKKILLIFIAFFIAMYLGCNEKKTLNNQITFRYRIPSDPPTLDPAYSYDNVSRAVISKIFRGLVQFDPEDLSVQPAVAHSWEISQDGLTYTFKLNQGVKFHNGREVVAEDFRYSFTRLVDPKVASVKRWIFDFVEGVEEFSQNRSDTVSGFSVIDPYTFRIRLNKPFAPFLSMLCVENAAAIPKEEIDTNGNDRFTLNPVGCGPFEFVHWQPDTEVKLKKFERYFEEPSKTIQEIEFKVITNVNVAFEAYKNNELDLLGRIPPGQLKIIQKILPEDIRIWNNLGTYFFGFNHEKAPFDNLKLRQAINYAIDRTKICDILEQGLHQPANGILPPGIRGYNPDLQGYSYDPEKAKKLMAEAGYPEGKGLPVLTLWYNIDEHHQRICQYAQQTLQDIGIQIKLKNIDWPAYIKALDAGEAGFFRLGWFADYPDPDDFLYIQLHSSQIGSKGNYYRYHNPRFDSLVEKAREIQNTEERIRLYQEAEKLAVEDACWVFIYHYQRSILIKPKWKNVVLPPNGEDAILLESLTF